MTPVLRKGEFTGCCLAKRETAGLTLTDYVFRPGHVADAHTHQNPHFYLVLHGHFRERCDGRAREVGPSALLFCPAGETHADVWGPTGGRCLNVELSADRAAALRSYTTVLDHSTVVTDAALIGLALRLHVEFKRRDRASLLAVEGLVFELLAAAERCPTAPDDTKAPPWLREAREIVLDRFAESLGLGEVAAQVGVHPTHLARAFRRHFGGTVGDLVRERRLDYARHALAQTDEPIGQIALAAGYSDQCHFSTAFRRSVGASPAAYRRAFRGGYKGNGARA